LDTVTITPRGPLLVRDGRPFDPSGPNRAVSVDWPYPSVTAGAVRTLLARLSNPGSRPPFDDPAFLATLRSTEVHGPLLFVEGRMYLPRPQDAVAFEGDGMRRLVALRPHPLGPDEGCDLPLPGLQPLDVAEDAKPAAIAAFWSMPRMTEWLAADAVPGFLARAASRDGGSYEDGFLPALEREERVNVSIDPTTGTSSEGKLFTTSGLVFPPGYSMVVRVRTPNDRLRSALGSLPTLASIGGERRLAEFAARSSDGEDGWSAPTTLLNALRRARGVRMVLATPAVFAQGWLPGWVDPQSLEAHPPGADPSLKLVLRSACLERWRPISGWSLEAATSDGTGRSRPGPKPSRRMVPAGAVYFFEVAAGDPVSLAERLWLESVCDQVQDRADGFGLALWGVWERPPH